MERKLLDELKKYGESDYYPLHMPGHKRRLRHFTDPFALDITEIHGFDNLFHAEDILLEAQQRAAGLYHADETFYLVNGSTCGILAAVAACTARGGRILMARNCHKAAYHAVLLNGLHADYLYPSVCAECGISGSIRVSDVRTALEADAGGSSRKTEEGKSGNGRCCTDKNKIQAVLITSPTYDGIVSDIEKIAEAVHEAGAVLIVDEAHGAHFAMHSYFPASALALGADIVINSIHKTMPSLTQTALLHVKGTRADRERLKKYLGIYQSSSPSYVLMAGIDACVNLMLDQREVLFEAFVRRLRDLRENLGRMQLLHLLDGTEAGLNAYACDRSKVIISTAAASINGPQLAGILREEYHLEVEMEAEQYVTAIMTVADTQEGFDRLEHALLEIDRKIAGPYGEGLVKTDAGNDTGNQTECRMVCVCDGEEAMTMEQAENADRECVLLSESSGRISGEFIYLYPPGIPILVPGERIPAWLPEQVQYYRAAGLQVQGLQDYTAEKIQVVTEDSV